MAKSPGIKVAVVGGETLLGKDLRETLEQSSFASEVQAYSAEDPVAGLRAVKVGDDAPILTPLSAADLRSTKIVFIASTPESAAKVLAVVSKVRPAPAIIDLSGALDEHPEARLRAPQVEPPGAARRSHIQVIAHPAAIALALFLRQLQTVSPVRRAVVVAFEPASERGQRGLDELQQQTVGLLSFKKLSQDVYDTQLAFNLLPRFGSDAPLTLHDIEVKIDRHLASLLAASGPAPMPSLRLVQAPVFHGYSFSIWVEFADRPSTAILEAGLALANIDVRTAAHEPATNVGAAGQSGITVGEIAQDRNDPRACWFWMVADNLRIAAENAVEVAREVV